MYKQTHGVMMYRIRKNDIAVMKGIAKSGALSVAREVGGTYNPKQCTKPCGNLPNHPAAYPMKPDLYQCGLSDLVVGDPNGVVIMWPAGLLRKAASENAFVWHTHPNHPNVLHSPPSSADFRVAVQVSKDTGINVDQLIVARLGLWRLRITHADVLRTPEALLQDSIENFQFYANFIQSEEYVARWNLGIDPAHRKKRMSPKEFVALISRNVHWYTIEYFPF